MEWKLSINLPVFVSMSDGKKLFKVSSETKFRDDQTNFEAHKTEIRVYNLL